MSATPSSPHDARYRQSAAEGDGRLIAPTVPRNAPPMIAELSRFLLRMQGTALEIGAGTGEHAANFALAFRGLNWQATDPDMPHLASISAWAAFKRAEAPAPFALDATTDWWKMKSVQSLGVLNVILTMNVIHIAPIAVLDGIIRGAGETLAPGGYLFFYGPFKENGVHTGEGNAVFDRNLRTENADWGIRDIAEIDERADLHEVGRLEVVSMPANNRLLVYQKRS